MIIIHRSHFVLKQHAAPGLRRPPVVPWRHLAGAMPLTQGEFEKIWEDTWTWDDKVWQLVDLHVGSDDYIYETWSCLGMPVEEKASQYKKYWKNTATWLGVVWKLMSIDIGEDDYIREKWRVMPLVESQVEKQEGPPHPKAMKKKKKKMMMMMMKKKKNHPKAKTIAKAKSKKAPAIVEAKKATKANKGLKTQA